MINKYFFFIRIGSEHQYSIALTWNNGFKEEIPSSMLNQRQHGDLDSIATFAQHKEIFSRTNMTDSNSSSSSFSSVSSSYHDSSKRNDPIDSSSSSNAKQLHPPIYSKRINIFSDASPFVSPSQHSVMSDLYGMNNSTSFTSNSQASTTTHETKIRNKNIDFESNDLDDGFGSLSSTSISSSFPIFLPNHLPSHSLCPFSQIPESLNVLEMDYGTNFYRTHFRDFEHQNWLQIHDKYGPIIVSIRKERIKANSTGSSSLASATSSSSNSSSASSSSNLNFRWRVIVRTTSLIPLRGTIAALSPMCLSGSGCWECSSSKKSNQNSQDMFNINSVKDVLSLVVPKSVNIQNFR